MTSKLSAYGYVCALVVASAVVPISDARAQFKSGGELLSDCRNNNAYFSATCLGYIISVYDVLKGGNTINGFTACAGGQSLTVRQISDIVVDWLVAHPDLHEFAASGLVAVSFSEAFPCSDEPH